MTDIKLGVFILLLIHIQIQATCQSSIPGRINQIMEDRNDYILSLHDSIKGTDRILINGELYYPHQKGALNHPFFSNESWLNGSVTIKDQQYQNCLLRYDLFLDQLLYLHIADGANTLALNREMVNSFFLGGSHFVYFDADQLNGNRSMKEGYYEEVYLGNIGLYARRTKRRIRNDGFRRDEFQQDTKLFLYKEGTFTFFRNDRQLRKALGDHGKEVRQFMRQNNIHVNIDPPSKAGLVITYYEDLKREER